MRTVTTSDGVALAVDVGGPDDAGVAVVMTHGWCLSSEIYREQRRRLAALPVRLVSYDTRGHGRSGPAPAGSTTVDQLAEDLRTVIEASCEGLPVILVGHSLGGMTIMALAEREPALFAAAAEPAADPPVEPATAGDAHGRVAGVVLVNTAAGDLDTVTLGVPRRLSRLVRGGIAREFARRHRRHLRRGDGPVRRRLLDAAMGRLLLFGRGARRDDVRLGRRLIATTHPGVMAGFFGELMAHDRHGALRVLAATPVRVLAGGADRLTPVVHSRRIAAAIPGARLSVFPGAGHMIPLERPAELTREITSLTRRISQPADLGRLRSP